MRFFSSLALILFAVSISPTFAAPVSRSNFARADEDTPDTPKGGQQVGFVHRGRLVLKRPSASALRNPSGHPSSHQDSQTPDSTTLTPAHQPQPPPLPGAPGGPYISAASSSSSLRPTTHQDQSSGAATESAPAAQPGSTSHLRIPPVPKVSPPQPPASGSTAPTTAHQPTPPPLSEAFGGPALPSSVRRLPRPPVEPDSTAQSTGTRMDRPLPIPPQPQASGSTTLANVHPQPQHSPPEEPNPLVVPATGSGGVPRTRLTTPNPNPPPTVPLPPLPPPSNAQRQGTGDTYQSPQPQPPPPPETLGEPALLATSTSSALRRVPRPPTQGQRSGVPDGPTSSDASRSSPGASEPLPSTQQAAQPPLQIVTSGAPSVTVSPAAGSSVPPTPLSPGPLPGFTPTAFTPPTPIDPPGRTAITQSYRILGNVFRPPST